MGCPKCGTSGDNMRHCSACNYVFCYNCEHKIKNFAGNVCPQCGSHDTLDSFSNWQRKQQKRQAGNSFNNSNNQNISASPSTSENTLFDDKSEKLVDREVIPEEDDSEDDVIEGGQSSRNSSNNSRNNSNRRNYRSAKMHWLYFLLIGWWLGLTMACLIFPLFIRGFVKKSFGYW